MENVKKIIFGMLLLITGTLVAQSTTNWQNAFYNSYEAETNGKYAQAINELMPVYKVDDYFVNLRLGWGCITWPDNKLNRKSFTAWLFA